MKGSKKALVWNEESDRAFEKMNQALLSAMGLQLVDPDRRFVLRTSASNYVIGSVLEQMLDNGRPSGAECWRKARDRCGGPVRRRHMPWSWLSGSRPGA